MMITSFLMEKDIFRLIEFYLEKATLSASLILAECRTRVTYEFLNGPYSPKSLCGSVVVKSERGRVFSSSVENFRVSPLEHIYSISFPHYLKLSTKSRFYKYFSAV